ncbi:MAG: hypothetical protein DHS20C11_36580 [Lysobacteraceae bacterium]|nr:MAG: hypothetical protein DHS20C11_36580 [Xanthomonadaceae bacterium]
MSNTKHSNELGRLKGITEHTREDLPNEQQTTAAQSALMQRLSEQKRSSSPTGPLTWKAMAWAAPAGVTIVAVLMLLVGGPTGPKSAFAEVQRYFEEFETLFAHSRIEAMGSTVWEMEVYVDRDGRSRIDMRNETTYVVDPTAGTMTIYWHQQRIASQTELYNKGEQSPAQAMDWLDKIRNFQGQARRLPERLVRGQPAVGYELDQNGHVLTVWASVDDGRPLQLTGSFGAVEQGAMGMTVDFEFDQPVDPGLFDTTQLPEGYRWAADSD